MLGRDILAAESLSKLISLLYSYLVNSTTYTVIISIYVTHGNRSAMEDVMLENVHNVAMSVLYAYAWSGNNLH